MNLTIKTSGTTAILLDGADQVAVFQKSHIDLARRLLEPDLAEVIGKAMNATNRKALQGGKENPVLVDLGLMSDGRVTPLGARVASYLT